MMYFKKLESLEGDFAGIDGRRYVVSVARRIRNAEGVNAGYELFGSLADALAAWGLEAAGQEVAP